MAGVRRAPLREDWQAVAQVHRDVITDVREKLCEAVRQGRMDVSLLQLWLSAIEHSNSLGWMRCDVAAQPPEPAGPPRGQRPARTSLLPADFEGITAADYVAFLDRKKPL